MHSTTIGQPESGATKPVSTRLQAAVLLLARALLVTIFILSGLSKIGVITPTMAYMQAQGVPGVLIYPTIAFEIGAGLLVLIGLKVRVTALLLAGFCLVTGIIFHNNLSDQIQVVMLLKNISMAGGCLLLAVFGGGALTLEARTSSTTRTE